MAVYELVVLGPSAGQASEEATILEILEPTVKKAGGKVKFIEELGEKQLVYRIKGMDSGVFGVYEVDIEEKKVKELNKLLKLQKSIIRYILIKSEIKH